MTDYSTSVLAILLASDKKVAFFSAPKPAVPSVPAHEATVAIHIMFKLADDCAKNDLGTIAAECSANFSSFELVNKNSREAF